MQLERLNGYPVIEFAQHANGYATVMVAKPTLEAVEEFVVATWWPDLGTTWMWGHYFQTAYNTVENARAKAAAEFNAAQARNRAR